MCQHNYKHPQNDSHDYFQTHANPTFYKVVDKDSFCALKKDESRELVIGDQISLLPNQHVFQVVKESSIEQTNTDVMTAEQSNSEQGTADLLL